MTLIEKNFVDFMKRRIVFNSFDNSQQSKHFENTIQLYFSDRIAVMDIKLWIKDLNLHTNHF